MRILFSALAIIFCNSVFAVDDYRPLYTPVNFVTAQQAIQQLNVPLNAMAATPVLKLPNKNGAMSDRCSAAIVSDDGTLLTAGHCMELCLQKAGAIHQNNGISVVDRTKLSDLTCPIMINGKTTKVKILATNDCRGKDIQSAGNAQISCKGLDFAVLKEVGGNSLKESPCFTLAMNAPEYGTPVGAIGYPAETNRGGLKTGAGDSNGTDEYYSPGKTIAFQNFCTPLRDDAESRSMDFGHPDRAAILKRNIEAGNLIQTSGAEALYEMSGGALMDTKTNELVGIDQSFINNSPYVECDGSSFHTSTAGILSYLKSDFPQVNLDEAFKCTRTISPKVQQRGYLHMDWLKPGESPDETSGTTTI